MVTFDRDSEEHGLLILPNGDQYDVYGSSIEELKQAALELASILEVEIEVWNLELPE